ncbi:uncharacterized protein [Typha angustifolia]|uniref:uncharacterized protein isoform X2 n=1 Tax=Typha angustifolia TaxID=59011 RepID=UPI003C2DE561
MLLGSLHRYIFLVTAAANRSSSTCLQPLLSQGSRQYAPLISTNCQEIWSSHSDLHYQNIGRAVGWPSLQVIIFYIYDGSFFFGKINIFKMELQILRNWTKGKQIMSPQEDSNKEKSLENKKIEKLKSICLL